MFQCSRTCQGLENGLFDLRFMKRPWSVQGCLLRQEGEAGVPGVPGVRSALGEGVYTWKEGIGDRSCGFCVWGSLVFGGESREKASAGEGAVPPVSEERRQGKKDKAATRDCNMSAVVFLSYTAVILTKRSSSHPCGVRLESPNLSAALLNLAARGCPRPHTAAVVMFV